MDQTRPTYPNRTAVTRLAQDPAYRAHVIEDGRAAQAEMGLDDAAWHALIAAALARDAALRFDPTQPTEVDHGEADAAGAKG